MISRAAYTMLYTKKKTSPYTNVYTGSYTIVYELQGVVDYPSMVVPKRKNKWKKMNRKGCALVRVLKVISD